MSDPTPEALTYDSDRLIREWRERFTGRRTVAWQMLAEAEVLVRDAIAREIEQERRTASTERQYDLERREARLEHAERLHQWQIDRLQRDLAEARLRINQMSPRQTLMREERETVEDGTVVRLLAPTVPNYVGDGSTPRPWMLGEIEDVTHRLRIGGADDTTELRFKRDAIEACVPFAEFALTPQTPQTPTSTPRTEHGYSSLLTPTRATLVALLLAVVAAALLVVTW